MSHSTWLHRIARLVAKPLAHSPVTPNHLTTARLLAGVVAAAMFAIGEEYWSQVGAGLFVLSMILDRADGDLARMTGKTSPFGHTYDLVADTLCNALAFAGIGLGLRHGELGGWAVALGSTAGLAVATVLLLVISAERRLGPRGGELAGAAGFDPDDAMLVVPAAVMLGFQKWLIFAAALGAPLFAAFMWWRIRSTLGRIRQRP